MRPRRKRPHRLFLFTPGSPARRWASIAVRSRYEFRHEQTMNKCRLCFFQLPSMRAHLLTKALASLKQVVHIGFALHCSEKGSLCQPCGLLRSVVCGHLYTSQYPLETLERNDLQKIRAVFGAPAENISHHNVHPDYASGMFRSSDPNRFEVGRRHPIEERSHGKYIEKKQEFSFGKRWLQSLKYELAATSVYEIAHHHFDGVAVGLDLVRLVSERFGIRANSRPFCTELLIEVPTRQSFAMTMKHVPQFMVCDELNLKQKKRLKQEIALPLVEFDPKELSKRFKPPQGGTNVHELTKHPPRYPHEVHALEIKSKRVNDIGIDVVHVEGNRARWAENAPRILGKARVDLSAYLLKCRAQFIRFKRIKIQSALVSILVWFSKRIKVAMKKNFVVWHSQTVASLPYGA
jgi:hypothetical protein